jgi:hypothetical protein
VGFKATAGFKATDKSGGNTAIAAIKSLGTNLVSSMQRTGSASNASQGLPVASAQPPPLAAAAAAAEAPRAPPPPPKVIYGHNGAKIMPRPMTRAELLQVRGKKGLC